MMGYDHSLKLAMDLNSMNTSGMEFKLTMDLNSMNTSGMEFKLEINPVKFKRYYRYI